MVDPIGPVPFSPPPLEEGVDKDLAEKLKTVIGKFSDHLEGIMKNPHQIEDQNSLTQFSQLVIELDIHSKQAAEISFPATTIEENLKVSGDIIQNVVRQPLSIPGAENDLSLLQAAQSFSTEKAHTSDLRKILQSFLQFPDPTNIMLRELELLKDAL